MSYDPQLADNISLLRFRVGDTAETEMLPDGTYQALLDTYAPRMEEAELAVVRALIARYGQQPSAVTIPTLGSVVEWRDRIAAWQRQAARLEAQMVAADASAKGLRTRRVYRFGYGPDDQPAEYVRGTDWTRR